jgi:hypothetical protein
MCIVLLVELGGGGLLVKVWIGFVAGFGGPL